VEWQEAPFVSKFKSGGGTVMINLRANHNLEELVDAVGQMSNDVQSIITLAVESAKEEIANDLINIYQIGYDDLVIDFQYNDGNYTLTVDGINQYQLYNNIGVDMDYIMDFIQNKILERIKTDVNNAGFLYGN
jgi:hypothetical protein